MSQAASVQEEYLTLGDEHVREAVWGQGRQRPERRRRDLSRKHVGDV